METQEQQAATFGVGLFPDHEKLLPFLFAGNATFTIKSKKTGVRFTYKVREAEKQENLYFVSLLNGPDNWSNYEYLGIVKLLSQRYYHGSKSVISETSPSNKAVTWFFHQLFSNPENLFSHLEVWHEGKCGRCGRKLTVPESIESGFGPECIGKL